MNLCTPEGVQEIRRRGESANAPPCRMRNVRSNTWFWHPSEMHRVLLLVPEVSLRSTSGYCLASLRDAAHENVQTPVFCRGATKPTFTMDLVQGDPTAR